MSLSKMINLKPSKALEHTIEICRKKNIILPTFEQMKDPSLIPEKIVDSIKKVDFWDINPLNLFRITWRNDFNSGGFGEVNFIELPKELTGVDARIVSLIGKYFPTGAHKVGATYGVLADKLMNGEFDPIEQKALWPSTGNYCRGGAFNSSLLGCKAIAVLPEEMSEERFEWLESIGSEVIKTPGCESNVKEIFDECNRLEKELGDKLLILNQFELISNPMWHYSVTGSAMERVFKKLSGPYDKLAGIALTQGSGGVLGSSMYIHSKYPKTITCAAEALQCPTLLENGFGGHRIEGIGDKHVPWVINCKDINAVCGIDDQETMDLFRLFNSNEGHEILLRNGVDSSIVENLDLFGISSIANILSSIKLAKHYELTSNDFVLTVATDSAELYQSRLKEMEAKQGPYTSENASAHYWGTLINQKTDYFEELRYIDKRRIHNLKYYTWVEQQGKTFQEINQQWYDNNYWVENMNKYKEIDEKIKEFNEITGVIHKYL